MKRKVIYQEHHPDYTRPDWTIKLRRYHHYVVSVVQRLNPTTENIHDIANLIYCLSYELGCKEKEMEAGICTSRERVSRVAHGLEPTSKVKPKRKGRASKSKNSARKVFREQSATTRSKAGTIATKKSSVKKAA